MQPKACPGVGNSQATCTPGVCPGLEPPFAAVEGGIAAPASGGAPSAMFSKQSAQGAPLFSQSKCPIYHVF